MTNTKNEYTALTATFFKGSFEGQLNSAYRSYLEATSVVGADRAIQKVKEFNKALLLGDVTMAEELTNGQALKLTAMGIDFDPAIVRANPRAPKGSPIRTSLAVKQAIEEKAIELFGEIMEKSKQSTLARAIVKINISLRNGNTLDVADWLERLNKETIMLSGNVISAADLEKLKAAEAATGITLTQAYELKAEA